LTLISKNLDDYLNQRYAADRRVLPADMASSVSLTVGHLFHSLDCFAGFQEMVVVVGSVCWHLRKFVSTVEP
jgi:hypothetical protein